MLKFPGFIVRSRILAHDFVNIRALVQCLHRTPDINTLIQQGHIDTHVPRFTHCQLSISPILDTKGYASTCCCCGFLLPFVTAYAAAPLLYYKGNDLRGWRRLQPPDLGGDHIRFDLESKLDKADVHLAEPREVGRRRRKPLTEQAFDIALTVQFGIAPTVAMR